MFRDHVSELLSRVSALPLFKCEPANDHLKATNADTNPRLSPARCGCKIYHGAVILSFLYIVPIDLQTRRSAARTTSMATPLTDVTISMADAPRQPNGHTGERHLASQLPAHAFNVPPAGAPLSFHATYNSLNNRGGTSAPQRTTNQPLTQIPSIPSLASGGPRRGSFPDILPHGHTPPPPINDSLLHLMGGLSDMSRITVSGPDDHQTDSDPEFRNSTPATRRGRPPNHALSAETSVIAVNGQGNETVKTAGISKSGGSRRNKRYVLEDGSVVSGKGLGRGRPGIKRGPRKSNAEDQASPQVPSITGTDVSTPGSGPASKKQKNKASESSMHRASTVDSAMSDSAESLEEYNPSGHTRFGRNIQKPTILPSVILASASPSGKIFRNSSTVNVAASSPASIKTHPKIKRRVYRGREQLALCEHCLRGHGPPGNVIVFCDACNKCWHQRCHDPQISKQTVSDSKAEWYCSECDRILHGKKKDKKTNDKATSQPVTVVAPVVQQAPTYAGSLVGGRFLRPEQKLGYLKTLSKEDLVSRLLHAADLAPDLPIFQTLVPPPPPPVVMPQAQFTSSYVTPVSKVPSFGDKDAEDDEVDEGYDGYFDEHAALYPKAGRGLQLPPESEDLHMLLEGRESRTFSHWQRSMPGPVFCGSGNVASTRH